jgi:cytochrome b561
MADFESGTHDDALAREQRIAAIRSRYAWPSHGEVAGPDLIVGEISGAESADRPSGKYTPRQQRLHWIVAALVLLQLAIGITLGFMPRQPDNQPFLDKMMILHLVIGTVIFVVMVVRWRLRRALGAPGSPPGTPYDASLLARLNHYGFYVLLLTLPVVGWLAFGAGGRAASILGGLHGALAFTLILAICGHLAGVAYHTYIRRDGLLERMTR